MHEQKMWERKMKDYAILLLVLFTRCLFMARRIVVVCFLLNPGVNFGAFQHGLFLYISL